MTTWKKKIWMMRKRNMTKIFTTILAWRTTTTPCRKLHGVVAGKTLNPLLFDIPTASVHGCSQQVQAIASLYQLTAHIAQVLVPASLTMVLTLCFSEAVAPLDEMAYHATKATATGFTPSKVAVLVSSVKMTALSHSSATC
jgi:hypothetical protein